MIYLSIPSHTSPTEASRGEPLETSAAASCLPSDLETRINRHWDDELTAHHVTLDRFWFRGAGTS